jgi:hypothetical protein
MLVVYSEIILVNRRGIIDRVTECLSLRRNWVPPPPPPSCVTPPPRTQVGGRHTRLRERGWGAQFRRRDRHFGTTAIINVGWLATEPEFLNV